MSINLWVIGGLILMLGSFAWTAWSRGPHTPEPNFLPFVPIDTRTTKVYVSKTRDASMYIETQRRLAILQNKPLVPSFKGSTNGYLEFGLTGLGVRPPVDICPPVPESVILSGGDADDEVCDIIDTGGAFGGYDAVDFGGAAGNVCDA